MAFMANTISILCNTSGQVECYKQRQESSEIKLETIELRFNVQLCQCIRPFSLGVPPLNRLIAPSKGQFGLKNIPIISSSFFCNEDFMWFFQRV